MNRARIGIGIIGGGGISQSHVRGVTELRGRARLVGVADLSASRLRRFSEQQYVPLVWTDYHRLLDRPDIDVAIIGTPPSTHEQLVTDALEAGKAVLCEKPLAHTLAAADRIIDVAARYPGKLCVIHQLRYDLQFERMRWLIENGWLGDLQAGRVERYSPPSTTYGAGWWGRWNVSGGGVVITQFIHQLDLMMQLLGEPIAVTASMWTQSQAIESEDTFEAEVRFGNGAVVTCRGSVNAQQSSSLFRVSGSKGVADLSGKMETTVAGHREAMSEAMATVFAPPKSPSMALPARATRKLMRMVFLEPSVVPKNQHPIIQVGVIRYGYPQFTATYRLGTLQGKASNVAPATYRMPLISRTVRMRAVLDQRHFVLLRDLDKAIHRRRVAPHVDHTNRPSPCRDSSLYVVGISRQCALVDVTEHRRSPTLKDRRGRREKSVCWNDHLITWPNPDCVVGAVECRRAAIHDQSVIGLCKFCEAPFKPCNRSRACDSIDPVPTRARDPEQRFPRHLPPAFAIWSPHGW